MRVDALRSLKSDYNISSIPIREILSPIPKVADLDERISLVFERI